jgi:ferritin
VLNVKFELGTQTPLSSSTDFFDLWQEQIAWEGIAEEIHINLMAHFNAMGLHGHKRMERRFARKELEERMCMSKFLTDNFGLIPKIDINYIPAPLGATLKEILRAKLQFYNENAARLDRLMNAAVTQNKGVAFNLIGDLVQCQYHSINKIKRAIQRFDDVSWMMHDIHVVDDHLHRKNKRREQREGHKID